MLRRHKRASPPLEPNVANEILLCRSRRTCGPTSAKRNGGNYTSLVLDWYSQTATCIVATQRCDPIS